MYFCPLKCMVQSENFLWKTAPVYLLLFLSCNITWKTENDYEIPYRTINSLIWSIQLCSKYTALEYVVEIAGFYMHTQVQGLSICPGHELLIVIQALPVLWLHVGDEVYEPYGSFWELALGFKLCNVVREETWSWFICCQFLAVVTDCWYFSCVHSICLWVACLWRFRGFVILFFSRLSLYTSCRISLLIVNVI